MHESVEAVVKKRVGVFSRDVTVGYRLRADFLRGHLRTPAPAPLDHLTKRMEQKPRVHICVDGKKPGARKRWDHPKRARANQRIGRRLGVHDGGGMCALPVGLLLEPCRGPMQHDHLNTIFGVSPFFAEEKHTKIDWVEVISLWDSRVSIA